MDGPATSARISRWGVVVMASALLVFGGAVALAIASVTSSHERKVARSPCAARSAGWRSTSATPTSRSPAAGQRSVLGSSPPTASRSGTTPRSERRVAGGELRLRSRCPDALLRAAAPSRYRLRRARQRPARRSRPRAATCASSGYRGSARVDTRAAADSTSTAAAASTLQARADVGDIRASRRLRAPAAAAALAHRLGAGARAARPLPASTPRATSGSRSVRGVDRRRRRPVPSRRSAPRGDVRVEGRP